MEKVCVLGLGYIGLPTASLVATKGFTVLGVDVNADTVATINHGRIHIHEPDLDILVKSAVQSGRLRASARAEAAEVFIIAVPTPFHEHGKKPDISYVESATQAIAPVLKEGDLVILESTSPVGTTEKIRDWVLAARSDLRGRKVHFAHCPERVLPGQILKELVVNDRIIGGVDTESAERARDFYLNFVTGSIFLTDSRTAELAKLSENAFRDVNIAFANELSLICDRLGIDVWKLIELANRHPRVNILQPGPGVGGHCIAVDPWFIVDSAPEQARLIRAAREVNDSKPVHIVEKVIGSMKGRKGPVACLGLAFKANVDDLRSSPAIEIVTVLAQKGLELLVVEPHIRELPRGLSAFPNVRLVSAQEALERCGTTVLLVDHSQFKAIPPQALAGKAIIDTRGMWK